MTFLKEVQRLFSGMILSNRTFIDPSLLVDALMKEGVDVNIGHQEDVGGMFRFTKLFYTFQNLTIKY